MEHLIIHNVDSYNTESFSNIISEGKNILLNIPGVREVFTGEAMEENSKYRFCWSVYFTHKAALESFQSDQKFESFLKQRFKPAVSDSMSINYLQNA